MKAGPERELADRYLDRFQRAGQSFGLDFGGVIEVAESRLNSPEARLREEAARLRAAADGSVLILLDERGKDFSSLALTRLLSTYRDEGARSLIFAIGGPDGHDADTRDEASALVAFGKATWPHQMVRILLAEQLYRATTILSGHPYHRA